MQKNVLKLFKKISIVCGILLGVELFYLAYSTFLKSAQSIYFDSINAMDVVLKDYVAVGSNNDNKKHYEKAKITKFDIKSNKKYEKIYNKGYNSVFLGVANDNGESIAVGSYQATNRERKKNLRTALIVKYDAAGEILFENSLQILGNSKFVNVKVVEDGYIVVGQSIYEDMTLGNSSDGGALLVKYDKNGKLLWQRNFGNNKSAIFNDVIIINNNIYVVGKDSDRLGIIVKYDLDGNYIDSNDYKYTDNFGFTSIVDSDNSLIVSGAKKMTNQNDARVDALLVKYDFNCNYVTESSYEEIENDRFNRIIKNENNDLIVIGSSAVNDSNKDNTNVNILKYDGIIAKYKDDLKLVKLVKYGEERDDHFTDIKVIDNNYFVSDYSSYEDGSYLSKFIIYSDAFKVLEVR